MEIVVRVVIIYAVVIAGLRVVGKREFGQLSPAELVTLLIIPEMVSEALTRGDHSLTTAIIGTTTLLSLVFVMSVVMHKYRRVEATISSTPTLLVHEGRFLVDNMNRERISPDEIFAEMHKVGLHALSQVRWVILETDGRLAVIAHEPADRPQQRSAGAGPLPD